VRTIVYQAVAGSAPEPGVRNRSPAASLRIAIRASRGSQPGGLHEHHAQSRPRPNPVTQPGPPLNLALTLWAAIG